MLLGEFVVLVVRLVREVLQDVAIRVELALCGVESALSELNGLLVEHHLLIVGILAGVHHVNDVRLVLRLFFLCLAV